MLLRGLVIKSTGNWYQVMSGTETYPCRIIGKFRLNDKVLTNPVAVGDEVKHHLHLLAANVDQAIVVVTLVEPNLKQGFIDRFLLMTEPHNIPCIIVFNKSDLFEAENLEIFNEYKNIYEGIDLSLLD